MAGRQTRERTWYWHAGGLLDNHGNKTEADWYSSQEYAELLSSTYAARAHAVELGLYNSMAEIMNKGETADQELARFVGSGLNKAASDHLTAAAQIDAKKDNYYVSGHTVPTSFNVEDLLGAGILLKQGLKFLGKIAAKNLFKKQLINLGNSADDFVKLFAPKNEYDVVKTLYRGTTGSETKGTMIFLTDDATVAASYIKQGGQVMKYEISEYALFNLRQRGLLKIMEDIHATGRQMIRHTTYEFTGSELRQALNQIAKPNK